jgi:DNA polymerase-3 subunit delta'
VSDDADEDRHPRDAEMLFGHVEAEKTLLDAYRSGQIAHAWLIGGPQGIGKATLAYRMARFVLANPDPAARDVQQATSLAVPADHPAARRISNQAHPDLLVLRRVINEKTGKLFQDIRVEDIRDAVRFFGSTAGEGGWRVAIVDSVEELNASGENSLLKILEEPPPRSLLLLISNAPGRVLPTIRSRCRVLTLRPLSGRDTAQAVASATGLAAEEPEVIEAVAAANGSVGRAIDLLDSDTLALRKKVTDLLAQLPSPDPQSMHALGDALGFGDQAPLTTFVELVNDWLSDRLNGDHDKAQMARVAETWDRINTAARDVAEYNLERKPLVFTVFGLLAEAARTRQPSPN